MERIVRAAAVLFDVFGTVVDWRRGVAGAVAPVLAAKGIALDPLAFADAWRAEYQPAMEAVRSGARGYVQLDDLHLENLQRVLAAHAVADRFDAAEKAALNTAWERLPAWPDAPSGLAAVREKAIVAPCSNGSIALMTRLARHAGLAWDCILGADVARAYKPDRQAYLLSAAALRMAPEDVLMVAAHEDDLAAARGLGFRTAFVHRPDEFGPGTAPPAEGGWDVEVADFHALAAALGA